MIFFYAPRDLNGLDLSLRIVQITFYVLDIWKKIITYIEHTSQFTII